MPKSKPKSPPITAETATLINQLFELGCYVQFEGPVEGEGVEGRFYFAVQAVKDRWVSNPKYGPQREVAARQAAGENFERCLLKVHREIARDIARWDKDGKTLPPEAL